MMIMSMRNRNRTGNHTPFCGECCDGMLQSGKTVKQERRRAKRRERRAWKREEG